VPLFENLPAEQRTAQAGILSINELCDILAVESGYEEGCKWADFNPPTPAVLS